MKPSTPAKAAEPLDPTVHFTPLVLKDGQSFRLAFDFEAIAEAEELTGIPLLLGVDWSKINARRLRAMLYASLLKGQPEITLKDAERLITIPNLPRIEDALVDSWMKSHPEPDAATPPKPEEPPA